MKRTPSPTAVPVTITPVPAISTVSATASAPVAAARTTIFTWTSFTHLNLAVVQGMTVELRNCLSRFFRRVHLDKAKPLRASGFTVHNDGGIRHFASLPEKLPQFVLGDTVGQISHV